MANETPNRVHAGGLFVPVVAAPFTSNTVNSQAIKGFTRLSTGQYQIALQRPLAFAEGYAEAALPANFQGVAGAQLAEDGASVLVTVLEMGSGVPIDPPLVSCTVWSVREGEGEGPSIPFPSVPPPLPGGGLKWAWDGLVDSNIFRGNYRVLVIGDTSQYNFVAHIPRDLGTLTKMVMVVSYANAFADGNYNLFSSYGATGEPIDNTQESDVVSGLSSPGGYVFEEIDLLGVATTVASGDTFGVTIDAGLNLTAPEFFGIYQEYI